MSASMVDLYYMRADTVIGREQIRETLSSFHVPAEVTSWFLEQLEEREIDLQQLRRQQHFLDMSQEQ